MIHAWYVLLTLLLTCSFFHFPDLLGVDWFLHFVMDLWQKAERKSIMATITLHFNGTLWTPVKAQFQVNFSISLIFVAKHWVWPLAIFVSCNLAPGTNIFSSTNSVNNKQHLERNLATFFFQNYFFLCKNLIFFIILFCSNTTLKFSETSLIQTKFASVSKIWRNLFTQFSINQKILQECFSTFCSISSSNIWKEGKYLAKLS